MKKITKSTLLFFTIIYINTINSQCLNDASTNPNNPINNEMKDANGNPLNGHTVNEFKNQFNWGSNNGNNWVGIPVYSNGLNWSFNPGNPMASPFARTTHSDYSYLIPQSGLPKDADWHWEDGWELMWMNLGYYPNLENISSVNPNRIIKTASSLANPKTPYFFLYNRYSGKLRHFGNLYGDLSNAIGQQVVTRLSHVMQNRESPVSGVFRHLGSFDRALDQPTVHITISSNNPYPGNPNTWFSSDFQLGFDPCVCVQPTTWQFEYLGINNWDVDLLGRQVSQTLPINAFESDFLTNNSIKNASNNGGGSLLFKNMSNMYNSYNSELQSYETKLAKYNRIQSQVTRELVSLSKGLIKDGVMAAVNPSLLATKLLDSTLKKILPKIDSKKAGEAAKKGTDMLLGKGLDFLSKQIVNPDVLNKPVKPTMPTATFSEMRIAGKFSQTNVSSITGFYNPGSFNSTKHGIDPFSYPIYNKPLGMFALLRTPSLKFAHIKANSSKLTWKDLSSGPEKTSISFLPSDIRIRTTVLNTPHDLVAQLDYEQSVYFKLKENLIYKLNHNLDFDFKKTNVFVSFLIEFESNSPTSDYYENDRFDINKGERKIDLSESNLSVFQHFIRLDDTTKERLILQSDWEDVTNSGELLFGGKMKVQMHKKIATGSLIKTNIDNIVTNSITGVTTVNSVSQNVELNYSDYIVSKYEYDNLRAGIIENSQFKIKKVTMKLMPDMYFKQVNSVGGQTNTTQSFTYLLFDADKNIDLIKDNGEWLNSSNVSTITKYNLGKLVLNNETISPNKPYVKSVQGNKIVIDQEYVEITGNTSVANGYTAEINAFYKIEVKSNATVSPKISLNIKQDYFNMPKTIEASQDYVNSFCSGLNKKYKADAIAASSIYNDNETDTSIQTNQSKSKNIQLKATISPNPTTGNFNVSIFNNNEQDYCIALMDVTGKVLLNNLYNGKQTSQFIETNGLAAGIYFVKITCGNTQKTEKLIIHNNQ